jgi:hypothetical protein
MNYAFSLTLILLIGYWIVRGFAFSFLFFYILGNIIYVAQLLFIKNNFPEVLETISFDLIKDDRIIESLIGWQIYFNIILLSALTISRIARVFLLTSLGGLVSTFSPNYCSNCITIKKEYTVFFIFFLMSYILAWFFPWPNFGENITIGHSITAWVKIGLTYMIAVVSVRTTPKKLILIALITLPLFAIDKSRTTFFHFLIIFLICNTINGNSIPSTYKIGMGSLIFLTFVGVTVIRNDKELDVFAVIYPFLYEGILGGYSGLQATKLIVADFTPTLYTLLYWLLDFVPRIFSLHDIQTRCETGRILHCMINESGLLNENFSPMGGHYILAETPLLFGYLSPFLFFIYVILYMRIALMFKDIALRVILISSVFLLIKADIYVSIKFAIANIVMALLISQLLKFPRQFITNLNFKIKDHLNEQV